MNKKIIVLIAVAVVVLVLCRTLCHVQNSMELSISHKITDHLAKNCRRLIEERTYNSLNLT